MPESVTPAVSHTPMLDVEHVAKAYGRHQVLKDVTFRLAAREIVAITGENGSGKSTLLNVIAGRLQADAGRVVHHAKLGFCPQEPLLFESLTVEENLRYFATAYGLHQQQAEWQETAHSLIDRFRLSRYARTPVNRLSGGSRQKLNLILAFLHSPDMLVLDEPYAGFDWETYLQFWEYAGELRAAGRCILVVAHLVFDRAPLNAVYRLTGGVLECA